MLPSDFLDLLLTHQWLTVSAIVLGFAIRLVKDDTKLAAPIPAEWRPWLAFILGAMAGLVELVVAGHSWQDAAATAIGAPLLAIAGHWIGIEKLRDGREIPVPFLTEKRR